MKKRIIYVFLSILLCVVLVGCGNSNKNANDGGSSNNGGGLINSNKTMTCTKEEVDEDGYRSNETVIVTYNSSKVLSSNTTYITETDPESIDFVYGLSVSFSTKFSELDGIKVNYTKVDDNKIKMTMDIEYDKINPEQIKETLGDLYDEDEGRMYAKKDYTIDEFKADNLKDYDCK